MVEKIPGQTQIAISSDKYLYPDPQPGDFVVLKTGAEEPLFNADIYDRDQVEEVVNTFGDEALSARGIHWLLHKHFGPGNYKHREENVVSMDITYMSEDDFADTAGGGINEPVAMADMSEILPEPKAEDGLRLTPDQDAEVDRLMNQAGWSASDAIARVTGRSVK